MIRFTKLLLLVGFFASFVPASAETDPKATFESATTKLEAGNTEEAIEDYLALASAGWHASELYHNLAIAHDHLNQPNRALAQAYRSLLLAPQTQSYLASFDTLADKVDLAPSRQKTLKWGVRATQWHRPLAIAASLLFWMAIVFLIRWRHQPTALTFGILSLSFAAIAAGGALLLHTKLPSPTAAWFVGDDSLPMLASHAEGAPEVGSIRPTTGCQTLPPQSRELSTPADRR